jgi:hypothetical protein
MTETAHDVIVMWIVTTLLRENMGQKTTMKDFAEHLVRELDSYGYKIVQK